MSINWREKLFNEDMCSGAIINEGHGDIIVTGEVKSNNPNPKILYWAPSPPTYSTSYYGSAHPYPNPEVAFDQTCNAGAIQALNRKFTFRLKYPNAYYVGLGTIYVPPHVHIKVCEPGVKKYTSVKIDDGIPYRTLTHPSPPSKKPRIGPNFYYEPPQEARSQETILRQSEYPSKNIMPDNFWGLKPPK